MLTPVMDFNVLYDHLVSRLYRSCHIGRKKQQFSRFKCELKNFVGRAVAQYERVQSFVKRKNLFLEVFAIHPRFGICCIVYWQLSYATEAAMIFEPYNDKNGYFSVPPMFALNKNVIHPFDFSPQHISRTGKQGSCLEEAARRVCFRQHKTNPEGRSDSGLS